MLNHLLIRQTELQDQIQELQQNLTSYPKEHLYIVKNGNYCKYYKSDGHTSTYIPKKDKTIATKLAHKKWNTCRLEECVQELNLINEFITRYENLPKLSENLLNDAAFCTLYQFSTDAASNNLQLWSDAEYSHNPFYPEQLQHRCLSGGFVRSKSEAIIANTLFTNHIPYRYECALSLGNKTYYPDFTIMHPVTFKIIYWEHFGMMDLPIYCDKAFDKLKVYGQHNIIPDINLITTYETATHPIDSEKVQQRIHDLLNLY